MKARRSKSLLFYMDTTLVRSKGIVGYVHTVSNVPYLAWYDGDNVTKVTFLVAFMSVEYQGT